MMMIEIQEAAKRGAKLMELRLDYIAKTPDFKRLLAGKPCPMIATVRRIEEGGRWCKSEDSRLLLLRQAVAAGFDWVDLETDVAGEIRRFKDVKRIVSYHNLQEVPENLDDIYQHMCTQDADIVKVAVTAQLPADNLRVLELLRDPPKPTIALCMGEVGMPSRILGARYGTPFTYGSFDKHRAIAPGLISFEALQNVYRYDSIDADTKVYGVIGDPVAHSLSPAIHNAAFAQLGINAVYLPFRVPSGQLPVFLQKFERLPVLGYSVTIPHKEAAMTGARHRDPAVALIQAANTLVRGPDGFRAFNTDISAARASLTTHVAANPNGKSGTLKGKAVLVLGSGGVARAVAHALDQEQALITVANRTDERAQKLAEEVGCKFVDWDARHKVLCEVLINCTSVGMHPEIDAMPIHPSFLKPGLVVFDTVYTPETTMLVKEARARECHVLTGVDMFLRQACLQFQLFTGLEPPVETMAKTVKRMLSPVALPVDAPS